MSIYKEKLESKISDRISQLQIIYESEDFGNSSERQQIEIDMELYIFRDILNRIQNFTEAGMILVPRNSNIVGVPHLLNTEDTYLNYAYHITRDPHEWIYTDEGQYGVSPTESNAILKSQNKLRNIIRLVERSQ